MVRPSFSGVRVRALGSRGPCRWAFRPRGLQDNDLPSLLDAEEVDKVVLAVVKHRRGMVFVGLRLAPF